MTKQELLNEIICKIENLGIELKSGHLEGAAAYISPYYGWGIWDKERATPFTLTHEYIHAKYKDKVRCSDNDFNNPCEIRANKEAIILLWDIFIENGGSLEFLTKFIENSGCPFEQTLSIIKGKSTLLLDHSNLETNNWHGDLKKCVVDYLGYYDVIDLSNLNVYDFLNRYRLSHNLYEKALKLLNEKVYF